MGFKAHEANEQVFKSLQELKEYVIIEKATTEFVPIISLMKKKAKFVDDEYFGYDKKWFTFNEEGFKELCNKFNIPMNLIKGFCEDKLASSVLNDIFYNKDQKEVLYNHQFVIDNKSRRVVGIVSCSYIDYSNKDFLEDLEKANNNLFKDFKIQECFIVNTKLYLRLLSPKIISGYAKGSYYEGDDTSQVGLQFKNSMIGNSAVKIDYYIYRAICSNGLIVETFENKNKIFHSGKRESFIERLAQKLTPIMKDIKKLPKCLSDLVDIEYSPSALANLGVADYIYKIIPLDEYTYTKRNKVKSDQKIEFDKEFILDIPRIYAGVHSGKVFNSSYRNNQSMFDFINIFTEYAHCNELTRKQQINIEEKTGEFMKWVLDNKEQIKIENNKHIEVKQLSYI
ncbi:DUF932 domain-containing protein [Clostridium sp. FP2]|uniref:DUF932 domain-containing protein n=1 Tax=Clostridium sp. FP2 TaxID=2724481 RepID=UPI0013E964FB|nr:DUF932 domain-containing protein [Clostridium sp. FP2]MBZ9623240.1 DUF932 domain-containing protein [Clostridium sp. FP2]